MNNLMDSVAVVIVHWGNPSLTQAAVRSVREGTSLLPQQIIVVENGASSTISQAEAQLISLNHNRGYAAGVNVGIHYALRTGVQYIMVMNNDLRYRAGTLEAILKHIMRCSNRVGCVGAVVDEGDGNPVYGGGYVSWLRGRARLVFHPSETYGLQYVSGAFFLMTRECIEDVGEMPEHYFHLWEDVDYGFRMRKRGWSLSWVSTPALFHPRSRSMRDIKLKTYYLVRNGSLFVRAHAPPWAKLWLLILEPLRELWARRHGRWEIVRALRDARAGVTGPLPEGIDLTHPL